MAGKSLTNFSELNCLEFGTLKIPYELMNKKFRCSQRIIDQCIFHFQKEFEILEQKLQGRAQPISLNEVSNNISKLNQLVTQFKDDIGQKLREEIEAGQDLDKQVEMLKQAGSSDSTVRKSFYDQRLNRFIVEHLLRIGYFETAQMLADYVGLDIQSQKGVYHVARQVEESLRNKDLSLCLNWVRDNRSRLHRIGSSLETEVRIQHCVELVKSGKIAESLKYVQSFFGSKTDLHGVQWMTNTNLLHLMGLIALGKDSSRSEHQPLLSDERYSTLIQLFKIENDRIYKFCTQSPFSACLQAGIAVHKTPQCKKDANSKCIVCSSVFALSEGLPYTHLSNSRLFCAISGEPFDGEDNRPMMLPNGLMSTKSAFEKLGLNKDPKQVTEEEWKKVLSPEQFEITRKAGTWPAFTKSIDKDKNIIRLPDHSFGRIRTEVRCSVCNAHLGHVFVYGFRIPIPFGEINFTKTPEGETQFGIGSNVNIAGSGAESNLQFSKNKNGTAQIQTGGGVLVDGKKFGTNSTFGGGKEGLNANTDIQAGKHTLHGGVGKESTFIGDLTNAIKEEKENKKPKN
ncbi:hypothetical protein Mgra_00003392 [Meloidogyne graminicola]|uniref:E3 ubiquitin-protein transferase MAEA n=1 Tax=Meloidogyne graminicola TaxID=189291 RepID=A0A8S9ZVA0_9BILA|nr:hypothetical protein Mgra_00003392 [Meloidogyne graminicola]